MNAPNSYWKNRQNVEEAVYHILTENRPELTSRSRKKVIEAIRGLPVQMSLYFSGIGLRSIMSNAFENAKKNTTKAIFEVFDRVYQRRTGDMSLFDESQDLFLEFDSKNRLVR